MPSVPQTAGDNDRLQFGLLAMMEWLTISAILFSLSSFTGMATSILLALMALALMTKRGLGALFILAGASLAADANMGATMGFDTGNSLTRQAMVLVMATVLCLWYRHVSVADRRGARL